MTHDELVLLEGSGTGANVPVIEARLSSQHVPDWYVLPARLAPPLVEALDAYAAGRAAPLVQYCQLLSRWFEHRHPAASGGQLLSLCADDQGFAVLFFHNNEERLSTLEVWTLPDGNLLQVLPVETWAHLLVQDADEGLDELGDTLFGEAAWQRIRRWLAD